MPRILVVDDESQILRLLRTVLTRAGHEVETANSGEAAVEACRLGRFALMLSDVRMPGMNGHELARWVATNYPETKTVLMSAFDLHCEGCSFSPRCRLISKPFRPSEIVKLLETVIGQDPMIC